MPTISRQDLDPTTAHITVTLTREDLNPKIDSELKRFRQRATVKGFRPGQAPMNYVKSMYGSSIFYDTFNDMMSDTLSKYLQELNLNILGQPLPIEDQPHKYSFKIDSPETEYSVVYEIGYVTEFELAGIGAEHSFERLVIEEIDHLAEEDFDYTLNRAGERTNPDDTIQDNDVIYINAREIDPTTGEDKEGGWETRVTVLVKSIKDETLKATILTKQKGDLVQFKTDQIETYSEDRMTRKFLLNLPEDDTREVGDTFRGEIDEVNRIEKPEQTEAFFQENFGSDVTTKEQAIALIKVGIQRFYDARADAMVIRNLREHLVASNPIQLPDTFLKRWLAVTNTELTPERIEAEYEPFAKGLRWSMINSQLKEKYNVVVTEDDIRAAFSAKVRGYFQSQQIPMELIDNMVDRMMGEEKEVEKINDELEGEGIFKALMSDVTIVNKAIPSAEFHKIFESLTKAAEEEEEIEQALIEG